MRKFVYLISVGKCKQVGGRWKHCWTNILESEEPGADARLPLEEVTRPPRSPSRIGFLGTRKNQDWVSRSCRIYSTLSSGVTFSSSFPLPLCLPPFPKRCLLWRAEVSDFAAESGRNGEFKEQNFRDYPTLVLGLLFTWTHIMGKLDTYIRSGLNG